MMKLNENLLSFKQNFMWLTGGLVGMLAAQRWIIPEADISIAVLIGILVGGNLGAYLRNTGRTGAKFDERDRRNMEDSMAWGFMAAVTLLALNVLAGQSFTGSDILLISGGAALLATLVMETRQRKLFEDLL